VDSTIREIRRDSPNHTGSAAFGGIQLIVCGDFSQLPPVPGDKASLENTVSVIRPAQKPVLINTMMETSLFENKALDILDDGSLFSPELSGQRVKGELVT
jgi:hypothetical protein